jgi:hypothetical protein
MNMNLEDIIVKPILFSTVLVTGLIATSIPAIAEVSQAAHLRLQCEEERQEQLAPLREKEIEECANKRPSRKDCEAKFRDFGNADRSVTGGLRLRMFDDLPSCVAAREAEQAEEKAQREERKQGEGVRGTAPGVTRGSSAASITRDSSTGTTTRDTVPGTTRDSSTGTVQRDTAPGKKRDTK